MYSAHNSAAISQPALSLSSPTLLHAVFGMKNPLLINTEFKCQIRSDGRCILAVLTTHCIPPRPPLRVCVHVCRFFFFLFFYYYYYFRESREKRSSVCTAVSDFAPNLPTAPWKSASGAFAWHRRFAGSQGMRRRGKGESWSPGWVGEESGGELGGSSEAPSPDSKSRAGIKVACFMWLVRTLWSPRVTYSTHFIKFSSVLIADQ